MLWNWKGAAWELDSDQGGQDARLTNIISPGGELTF